MCQLRHIPRTESHHIEFGKKLGLDLTNCTVTVALARIEDAISSGFHGKHDLGAPSLKQIELARKFDLDISQCSRREGHATIDDLLTNLNRESIESQHLEHGVIVIHVRDKGRDRQVISSIADDGTVYFKGGNGKRAWARNLRRADPIA